MRRRRIDLGEPLHARVDSLCIGLAEANDEQYPTVMVRGNELVRMTERGELEGFNRDSLADVASWAAQYERMTNNGPKPKDPPAQDVQTTLSRDSQPYVDAGLPQVERVIDVPVLDHGGQLVTQPGLNPEAKLYYRPAEGLGVVTDPAADLTSDVEEALRLLLDDLLVDFRFDDQASQAHAVAMLLQPFVREYIDGPTPMYGIFAPGPGTGKSYLAETCLMPGCGKVPATAGAAKDDAEWRKKITAMLLAGSSAIVFDNLHGTLKSASLAGALTTGVWSDRILGESRVANLPVRNVWVATANNPSVSDEQARRIVPIFLDPGDVRPSDRTPGEFKHDDLIKWAQENRGSLVRAALVLIEHWRRGPVGLVEGGYRYARTGEAPQHFTDRTLGSYTEWSKVLGGILHAAGIEGFLGNLDRLNKEANEERRDSEDFFAAWHRLGIEPTTAADLYERYCGIGGELYDLLPAEVAEVSPEQRKKKLGYWLRSQHKNLVGDYRLLHEEESHGHTRRWLVQDRTARPAREQSEGAPVPVG